MILLNDKETHNYVSYVLDYVCCITNLEVFKCSCCVQYLLFLYESWCSKSKNTSRIDTACSIVKFFLFWLFISNIMQPNTLYKLMTSRYCVWCFITMMMLDANKQICTGCNAGTSTLLFWNFKFILISSPSHEPPLSLALSLFMNESYFTNLDVQELHFFLFTQNYSAFSSSNSMKQYNLYEIKSNCMSNWIQ